MKKVYVQDIEERDWVEAPFLVRDKIVGMAKNGKPYLTLKLMDRTGEVEGRIWDRVDEISALFAKDDFVRVAGKASVYMGKMQLVLQELERLEDHAIDLSDFLPVSTRRLDEMIAQLQTLVAGLASPHLRSLMEAFLADQQFMAGYTRAPAAKTMHHAYLGGLLEHSLAVAVLADDLCQRYADLDRDLLVVGALLHDVGKVEELRYQRSFEYTDTGKLLGHIVIGVELVEARLRHLPGFPLELSVLLKHLLLSHHGQYEFGSPKRPKTMEAVILSFLDDLDSKINGVRTHIEKEPDSDSPWTRYHRLYDRYFLKGSLGLADTAPQAVLEKAVAPARSNQQVRDTQRSRFSNSLGERLLEKNLDVLGLNQQVTKDE